MVALFLLAVFLFTFFDGCLDRDCKAVWLSLPFFVRLNMFGKSAKD